MLMLVSWQSRNGLVIIGDYQDTGAEYIHALYWAITSLTTASVTAALL